MAEISHFFDLLQKTGVSFVTGVPDSLLKPVCDFIQDRIPPDRHVVAANEGCAVALAAGHYLGTGNPGLVYMQNSGLGNATNPLTSLADREVYGIPMLLLIGWRGRPGFKDEPQHVKQGRITCGLLDVLEVPYCTLSDRHADLDKEYAKIVRVMLGENRPVAMVVSKGVFAEYKTQSPIPREKDFITREEAIRTVLDAVDNRASIVSTTGKASRELYELREARGEGHDRDFLSVGSMGLASQIAAGLAVARPNHQVVCIDGDGAFLMHMGGATTIGPLGLSNYIHVVLNNGAYDSVGGQPTMGLAVDIAGIARSCGYRDTSRVSDVSQLGEALNRSMTTVGPVLIEVRVAKGARSDLGRPRTSPRENRDAFMRGM